MTSPSINITTSSNIINIPSDYVPIAPSENVIAIINEQAVSVNILDHYQGIIEIPSLTGTQTVDYKLKYKKSFKTVFTFQGKDNYENRYYLNGFDFELIDTPIKYKGIDHIRILDRKTNSIIKLEEGIDFEILYGNENSDPDGINIRIKFFENDIFHSNSKLSKENYPNSQTPITLIYQYTPDTSPSAGNLTQTMIGLTGGYQINPNWHIQTELVGSQHNFSKKQIESEKTFSGTGKDDTYNLGFRNIVEDSELVFINNELMNKNTHYIVNYNNGSIRFRNITPGINDSINIKFKYYDASKTSTSGEQKPMNFTSKVATLYTSEKIDNETSFKIIDKEFLPISPINDEKGSFVFLNKTNLKISKRNNVQFNYQHNQKIVGENDQSIDIYNRKHDFSTIANLNFYNIIDTSQTLRYLYEVQDPTTTIATQNLHEIDYVQLAYDGTFSTGPSNFRTSYTKKVTKKVNDYVDQVSPLTTISDSSEYNIKFHEKKLFLIGETEIKPNYSESQSESFQNSKTTQRDFTNKIMLHSNFKPIKSLNIKYNQEQSKRVVLNPSSPTESITKTKTNYQKYTYTPKQWFKSDYEFNHIESASPLLNQETSINESKTFSIPRFTPSEALVFLGLHRSNLLVAPIKNMYLSYSTTDQFKKENNAKNLFNSKSDFYSINNLQPIPGITFKSLSNRNNNSQTKVITTSSLNDNTFTETENSYTQKKEAYL